ncbi:histidine utilization repressor [Taklimakanibacter lacteus]|uniref:histidine utilization repressor n=1 Tax=Taklimakanibacter lacteus TaxID=2268456 RepID=UPI000E6683B8
MTAPLYAKVKEHILGHIRSGAWTPGMRVPSENELVETFSISRMTANRALRELTADGFLSRVPGVGTFVKEPPARSSLVELRNIADEIATRGHRHTAHIETRETIEASAALTEEFELRLPAKLFHLVMVHSENGVPVQLEERYVNPFAAPHFNEQDFSAVTPTGYLVAAVPVDELEHTVEAVMPTPDQQALLDIGEHEPCLALHRRSWSKGHVVTVVTLTYPASRYALHSRYKTSPSGTLSQ